MAIWIIAAVLVVLLLIWGIAVYNRLITERLKVKTQWSQIDVVLRQRFDMIASLEEAVKGYATHEKETLRAISEARARYLSAAGMKDQMNASIELSDSLGRLMAVAEAWPELKSNQNFLQLQQEISAIEKKLADYRQFYNDTVLRYNSLLVTIPTNLIAGLFRFKKESFFRLLIVVMFLPVFSLNASASSNTATLTSLNYDITLLEDGSAEITETREVWFYGGYEFTRYGVNNLFDGPRVFEDWQVMMDGAFFTMLEAPDNEERPDHTFAVENGDGKNTVYIYHRSTDVTRRFQISYRVENAVKRYSDVGEFFWNLTGKNGISGVANLTATLKVPEGIPEKEFRIWAHGPLDGTFEKQDDSSALLQVGYAPSGEIVDLRTTLPSEVFSGGWEQEGEGLPAILEEEKVLAEQANARREEIRQQEAEEEAYWAERRVWEASHPVLALVQRFCGGIYDFFYYNVDGQVLFFGGFFSFWIFGLTALFGMKPTNPRRFRHQAVQMPAYYRDLPDDRPAPAVNRLLNSYKNNGKGDISRQISAALLELSLKNMIQFYPSSGDAEIILNEYVGQEQFSEPVNQEKPKTYQEILWNFLHEAAGGKSCLKVKELKQYVKKNQDDAWNFRSTFEQAVGKVHTKWVQKEYLEISVFYGIKPLLWVSVAVGLAAVLIRMFSTLYDGIEFGASLTVGAIAFVMVLAFIASHCLGRMLADKSCSILNQKSENDLALWEAFGRFLDDFTTFDRKELPEFLVWREYMVYAVAMGKGQKTAEALAVTYPETSGTGTFHHDFYRFFENPSLYHALDSIGQEVAEVSSPASSGGSGSDHWSNSSGGGGGFSSSGGGSRSGSGGDFAD